MPKKRYNAEEIIHKLREIVGRRKLRQGIDYRTIKRLLSEKAPPGILLPTAFAPFTPRM